MLSSQEVIKNIDDNQYTTGHVIDATSLGASYSLTDPKLWNQSDYIYASSFSDDDVLLLLQFLSSPSSITRLHAMRCLTLIFTSCNHHISFSVFQQFFALSRAMSYESDPENTMYLFRQCFYAANPNSWICPICLVASPMYVKNCVCCNAPRITEVHSNTAKETYIQNRLHYATARLYLQSLLVMSKNQQLCEKIEVGDIRQILQFMKQGDAMSIVICAKLLWPPLLDLTCRCNILETKQPSDSELFQFLRQSDIYATIRSILSHLVSSPYAFLLGSHIDTPCSRCTS